MESKQVGNIFKSKSHQVLKFDILLQKKELNGIYINNINV